MTNRLQYIDAAKGIGIVFVMLGHAGLLNHCILFSCFISIFYFISGYTLKLPDDLSLKEFLSRKFIRLMCPFAFYGLFSTSFYCFYEGASFKPFFGLLYAKAFFWNGIECLNCFNSVMWFFPSLLLSLALSFVLIKLNIFLRSTLCLLGYILTIYLSYNNLLLPWSIESTFLCSMLVLSGYFTANIHKTDDNSRVRNLTLGGAFFLMFISVSVLNGYTNLSVSTYGVYHIISPMLYVIEGSFFSMFVILLCRFDILLIRLLSIVGRSSLRFMCLHLILYCIIPYLNPFSRFLVSFIAIALISKVMDYISEKHQFQFLNRL